MVKLTQIDDETVEQTFVNEPKVEAVNNDDFSDTDESASEDEDDFDFESETLYDRIVALKDIVPPKQRATVASIVGSVSSTVSWTASKSGNFLWVVATSGLLLGLPCALSALAEKQLMEMEKDMTLQQNANDILAPGSETAFQAPGTA
ncbi:hypothetical protein BABINDRAFT_158950 [Babjeviella inositovora NRRL Y-12698]|uniref:Mitochondrial import receptor subunit Tom22 n=1 Tax=Babjeviella inositovora NRRL Y-12698 TaxID=984486 RepID=A0A1E3QXJ4_9ASCO|nr:uncharacterized protein BABINDRAFT_158950 [Babjeviella inositovora NRRL Y-12698]ODQ82331.1 hypothetical protein BABINDRAFT_158950 [Babjeviella inositovora NRRL Y-12698]